MCLTCGLGGLAKRSAAITGLCTTLSVSSSASISSIAALIGACTRRSTNRQAQLARWCARCYTVRATAGACICCVGAGVVLVVVVVVVVVGGGEGRWRHRRGCGGLCPEEGLVGAVVRRGPFQRILVEQIAHHHRP